MFRTETEFLTVADLVDIFFGDFRGLNFFLVTTVEADDEDVSE